MKVEFSVVAVNDRERRIPETTIATSVLGSLSWGGFKGDEWSEICEDGEGAHITISHACVSGQLFCRHHVDKTSVC